MSCCGVVVTTYSKAEYYLDFGVFECMKIKCRTTTIIVIISYKTCLYDRSHSTSKLKSKLLKLITHIIQHIQSLIFALKNILL